MKDAVILIHGLGRTHWSLKRLELKLKEQGYKTYNQSYSSSKQTVELSSEEYISSALQAIYYLHYDKIHFVTHSLGGILVRNYLTNHSIENLGRIVMLAPPNHGSEVADKFKEHWWYQKVTGPAGQQLDAGNTLFKKLKPLETEVAVITGSRSSDPWFNHLFKAEHDGKVSVESAKLDEEHQFKVVNSGHTFLMENKEVQKSIINFLQNGQL